MARMAYALPGPNVRPGVVTAAAATLFAAAGIHALQLLVTVSQLSTMRREIDASAASRPEGYGALIVSVTGTAGLVVGIVITVALAAILAVLGALVAKGKQAARVTTWVVAGLLVLCTGLGLASTITGHRPGHATGQGTAVDAVNFTPGWVSAWNTGSNLLETLALALVVILLAVPAANDYFRKEQEGWIPPYAGPYPPSP